MGHKGKNFLVLVIVLFLVSLACNLPQPEQQFGVVLCLLTGGTWVEQTDGYGMCVKEPTEYAEKPASEEVVTSEEMIPQTDENTIQEQPTEPLTEDVVAPEMEQSSVNSPTEEPAGREETPDESIEDQIPGNWTGTAQWMCSNNAPCQVSLEIKADGTLSSTVACTTMTQQASGNWSLSDDKITLLFDGYAEIWTGTITDNRISGAITGGGGDCDGVWSASK